MSDHTAIPPSTIPAIRPLERGALPRLLRAGWRDFMRAPQFGLFFSLVYVLGGWALYHVFVASGSYLWFIPVAVGFPILAPFAAVGLYEVSRRLEQGLALNWRDVLICVWQQKDRQVPSMSVVILLIFMFWVFVAHTLFALFFGMQAFTGSAPELLMTRNGLMMLGLGTVIGGAMAAAVFALTVISLPLLLDRELDFVTAMITSVSAVMASRVAMVLWAGVVALSLAAAMVPGFLGLFVALPVLGHATWHLYREVLPDEC